MFLSFFAAVSTRGILLGRNPVLLPVLCALLAEPIVIRELFDDVPVTPHPFVTVADVWVTIVVQGSRQAGSSRTEQAIAEMDRNSSRIAVGLTRLRQLCHELGL